MLKPHSLRLNNVVCYQINPNKTSDPMFIESIGRDFVELNYEDCYVSSTYEVLQGIPITEEMLEKCEFKKIHYDQYNTIWANDDTFIKFEKVHKWCLLKYGQRIENLQYVHELQNAYYMLANEYLNVNI